MIDVSDLVRAVLDSAAIDYRISVQSWLGDQLLSDDVPVAAGGEDSDRSLSVPERVTFSVPKRVRGVDWTPTEDDSPLAAKGQTLKVSLGIGKGPDGIEVFQRGEFLIQDAAEADETVEVTAVGMLALIDEAKFISPYQPSGTISSTIRNLLEPAVTVDMAMAPVDRAVPVSAINWDSDRLGAVGELLDAWPAILQMNEGGWAEILPDTVPDLTDVVRVFESGRGGTIITNTGSSTRDDGFNAVVATGQAADGGEVRGVSYVTSGPWAYPNGPANPLAVPFSYSSPLLSTQPQCQAAADTVLRRKMRQAVLRRFVITCVIDPTIQLGDPVLVDGILCTVETINLPYFATGPMTVEAVMVG